MALMGTFKDISISELLDKNFSNPDYKPLQGADKEKLCEIINDKDSPILLRGSAFVALLLHEFAYFSSFSYSQKINMLHDFHNITDIIVRHQHLGMWDVIIEYLAEKYVKSFASDDELIRFANFIKSTSNPVGLYDKVVNKTCACLKQSDEAHTFLREITRTGNSEAGVKLARFTKEEDLTLLSYFFLCKRQRIGRVLPQLPGVADFEIDLPLPFMEVIQSLPAFTKLHLRLINKKWFNYFNNEKIWEKECAKRGFGQIPRFSWQQSYFLLENRIVVKKERKLNPFALDKETYFYAQAILDITEAFPHPFFLGFLFLRENLQPYQFFGLVAFYSPEELLSCYSNNPNFKTEANMLFAVLKEKGWDTNPIFAHIILSNLAKLTGRMENRTMRFLHQNFRTELLAKISEPNPGFVHIWTNFRVTYMEAIAEILNSDDEFFESWQRNALSLSGSTWLNSNIIQKFIPHLTNQEKVRNLLEERIRTTDNERCMKLAMEALGL
eukprot:Phypoly_transcript_07159.p1 GENE.Phypoly_transcript_07159~~Phypoly_transcript_07159.p1  ORF type:complete len:516 (+),score=57.20 Phypoly_transcript_07159:57-1550(+)